jgi:hypothetical protein
LSGFAAGAAESPAAEEAGKKSFVAGTGEWLYKVRSSGFFVVLLLIFLCFSDKRNEDQPKSSSVVANVDASLQEVPQQEVEKSVEGSTAIARGSWAAILLLL